MKIDESFVLKKGEILTLKKKGGYIYLEFKRRNEKHLDDIIELEYKSTGSKKKDPSVWIIEKDLDGWLSSLKNEGFTEININEDVESPKKNNKKKK
jgi:hypothetical protein